MSKPNYYFVNLAKSKAKGSTLQELRDQKAKQEKEEKKKDKKGKRDPIDKIYGKSKPYVNPNNKILLNTKERVINNMRENNRTKILMEMEYMP